MLLTTIMCLHTFVSLFDKYPLASIWDWGLLDDSQGLFTYLQQYDVINMRRAQHSDAKSIQWKMQILKATTNTF